MELASLLFPATTREPHVQAVSVRVRRVPASQSPARSARAALPRDRRFGRRRRARGSERSLLQEGFARPDHERAAVAGVFARREPHARRLSEWTAGHEPRRILSSRAWGLAVHFRPAYSMMLATT